MALLNRIGQTVLAIVMLASMVGCESLVSPYRVRHIREGSISTLDTNVNRRAIYFVYGVGPDGQLTGSPKIWAEPPPDTALQATAEIVAKLSNASQMSGEANAKLATTVVDLTKRTEAIVVLRDSLFRLAEAYANGAISQENYSTKFSEVLKAAQDIAAAEKTRADADKIKAESLQKLLDEYARSKKPELLEAIKALRGGDGADPR